jgi:hypothetical protein
MITTDERNAIAPRAACRPRAFRRATGSRDWRRFARPERGKTLRFTTQFGNHHSVSVEFLRTD